jgi:hypothetical protein
MSRYCQIFHTNLHDIADAKEQLNSVLREYLQRPDSLTQGAVTRAQEALSQTYDSFLLAYRNQILELLKEWMGASDTKIKEMVEINIATGRVELDTVPLFNEGMHIHTGDSIPRIIQTVNGKLVYTENTIIKKKNVRQEKWLEQVHGTLHIEKYIDEFYAPRLKYAGDLDSFKSKELKKELYPELENVAYIHSNSFEFWAPKLKSANRILFYRAPTIHLPSLTEILEEIECAFATDIQLPELVTVGVIKLADSAPNIQCPKLKTARSLNFLRAQTIVYMPELEVIGGASMLLCISPQNFRTFFPSLREVHGNLYVKDKETVDFLKNLDPHEFQVQGEIRVV